MGELGNKQVIISNFCTGPNGVGRVDYTNYITSKSIYFE